MGPPHGQKDDGGTNQVAKSSEKIPQTGSGTETSLPPSRVPSAYGAPDKPSNPDPCSPRNSNENDSDGGGTFDQRGAQDQAKIIGGRHKTGQFGGTEVVGWRIFEFTVKFESASREQTERRHIGGLVEPCTDQREQRWPVLPRKFQGSPFSVISGYLTQTQNKLITSSAENTTPLSALWQRQVGPRVVWLVERGGERNAIGEENHEDPLGVCDAACAERAWNQHHEFDNLLSIHHLHHNADMGLGDSFSKLKNKVKHLLAGKKRKAAGNEAGADGEIVGPTSSLPRPEPHVVAADSGEGSGANADGRQAFSTDLPP